MPSQLIPVDGIDFHAVHEGPTDAPLVVLCHALMANNHMWDSTVTALHAAGYSTLRYDQIGHGSTPAGQIPTSDPWHFDYFTTHIRALIRAVAGPEADPYAIIGCSMGGVLAMRYAMLYPGTVSKVICCDAPGLTSLESAKPKWRARMKQFREEGVDDLARATVERWFPDPCSNAVKEKALAQTRSCSLAGYEICAEAIMNYDYNDDLRRMQNPEGILVLVGENDEAVGPKEVLRTVAENVGGQDRKAEYVAVKDAGHLPPMHRSEEFERIILEFLRK